MTEPRWCDLTDDEKLDALRPALGGSPHTDEILERVREYSAEHPQVLVDPNDTINVVMREDWRQKHGNTAEWDRAAAVAGVVL